MTKKIRAKMSPKTQSVIILALFTAALAYIAYPVVVSNNSFKAVTQEHMHLKVDMTDDKKTGTDGPQPQISPPIFQENKN